MNIQTSIEFFHVDTSCNPIIWLWGFSGCQGKVLLPSIKLSCIKIPNFLSINNADTIISTLSTISTALAAILGIIMAILLVSFELLHKTYSYYAYSEIFDIKELKILFIFYLFTIFISIFSIVIIEDPLSFRNINLTYLSISLFLICLIILYPCIKRILINPISKKRIEELIEKIDYETIEEIENQSATLSYLEKFMRNPINILSEIVMRTIKDDDRFTPQFIIIKSKEKLIELLDHADNDQDKRKIIKGFLSIFQNSTSQALKNKNLTIIERNIKVIEEIHTFCAEKHMPWHNLVELNDYLQTILEKIVNIGSTRLFNKGMWTIEEIFRMHLKYNIPPEEEIDSLFPGKDVEKIDSKDQIEKDLQWDNVSKNYIYMIFQVTEKAIELKRSELISKGLRELTHIASNIIELDLGEKQKNAIMIDCYMYVEELITRCINQSMYGKIPYLSPFWHSDIYNIIKKNAVYSHIPIKSFGNILIELIEKGIPDTYEFSKMKNIAILVANKIDDYPHYPKVLCYICNLFNEIRELLEERLKLNAMINVMEKEKNIEIYSLITEYLKSINKLIEKSNNESIKQHMKSILEKFKNIEEFK